MWGSDRLSFSDGSPGRDPKSPLEIVIKDGASRTPHITVRTPDPMIWSVDSKGLAIPRVDSTAGWLLAAAVPPAPWKRAHSNPKRRWMYIQRDPSIISYDSVRLPERALLYVNPTGPLRRIEDTVFRLIEPQYEVVLVAQGLMGCEYIKSRRSWTRC
ncbi:hypothetical protein DL93DRAFT_2087551 [Clavulina sp. PMI_390]|nr:hypothetical protein DL93DRAFT_2087551 [Clavulina sp. PMI_390]